MARGHQSRSRGLVHGAGLTELQGVRLELLVEEGRGVDGVVRVLLRGQAVVEAGLLHVPPCAVLALLCGLCCLAGCGGCGLLLLPGGWTRTRRIIWKRNQVLISRL